ncbi:50S ribosomal protein L22 [archaeon]|jgi:large subunit ribosomal protein L22|nr:50S ribosomal protein L22 [archaeon]MBT6697692.1 50S ribosomal protein L22 [archaeon]
MATKKGNASGSHVAKASMKDRPISTKHSIEICNHLRYKTVAWAITELENVASLKKAVPFKRFNNDMGHKAGMAAGRYPVKAAGQFLQLIRSVKANAEDLGLNASSLKITKILANKASNPFTGRRFRGSSKRTHLGIEVKEAEVKKKPVRTKRNVAAKVEESKVAVEEKKPEVKVEKEANVETKAETKTEVKKEKTGDSQ